MGIIPAADASTRLAALVGRPFTGVQASTGRLVVRLGGSPAHLVVVSAPVWIGWNPLEGATGEPADPRVVATLTAWLGAGVRRVEVQRSGALQLDIAGRLLRVDSDPQYEAWEVRGMDGGLLACLPGGAISLWTPTFGQIPTARTR